MNGKNILIVGNSVSCADLFYFTGFLSEDEFVYFRSESEEVALISPMEMERGRRESKVKVESWKDYGKRIEDAILAFLNSRGVRSLTVPPYFPISLAERLREKGIDLRVSRISEERKVKSEEEIRKIRISQRIAGETMNLLLKVLRRSKERGGVLHFGSEALSSERMKKIANIKLAALSATCEAMIISSGPQTAVPHHRGEGVISSDTVVLMDIFPKHMTLRYHGDLTRTVAAGEVSQEVRDAHLHVLNAQNLAVSMIREGVSCREIHNAVVEYFEDHGYKTEVKKSRGFIHSTGHGIGLEIHEPPVLGESDEILQAGNVVTVEPGLYFPENFGVRVEDIVIVRKNGAEIIESGVEKTLEV